VNYWSVLFGLARPALGDFGAILRRRWWLIGSIVALGAAGYLAIQAAGGNLAVAALPAYALSLVGLVWIFADVMRIRRADYALDGRQYGQLIPIAIGMGLIATIVNLPGYLLLHASQPIAGQAVTFVLLALCFAKFAFVFYGSDTSMMIGDTFGMSWRATSGAAFAPTLVIVVLSMLVGQLILGLERVIPFAPVAAVAASVFVELLVMAFFSPWKIRWMGALLER
jgi:hypothetical protein